MTLSMAEKVPPTDVFIGRFLYVFFFIRFCGALFFAPSSTHSFVFHMNGKDTVKIDLNGHLDMMISLSHIDVVNG